MVVNALLTFEGELSAAALLELLRERLVPILRFRQRPSAVTPGGFHLRWEIDPAFSLQDHLSQHVLRPPGDDLALEDLVSELMSGGLDWSRALWQAHLIQGYRGGTALLVRTHHALADGVALLRLLAALTEGAGKARPVSSGSRRRRPRLERSFASLVRLLRLPADRPSALKGQVGLRKGASWSPPVSLAWVREAGQRAGATVNDVLLAAVAGGVRRYLSARGEPVDRDLRALVPVDLRRGDSSFGNRFGLVFLDLPLSLPRPQERLREVTRRMRALKSSAEATVAFAILQLAGSFSQALQAAVVQLFQSKVTLVVTNVRGPPTPVALAGVWVRSIRFWVPQAAALGIGISLFSYRGEVTLGVAADRLRVPRPRELVEAMERELDALLDRPRPLAPGELSASPA